MLWKLLKAEKIKLKHSPVWLAFLVMPVIPAMLGTLNYLGNIEVLKSEWYSLWTQHTLFTCYFFLPIMLGVYCSYLMRLEHQNHNWNKILTMPVKRSSIFLVKLLMVVILLVFSEAWIGILYVVSGKIIGMAGEVPVAEVLRWCLFGTLGGTVMASIQLLLSMFIKSFALPVGISFAGGLSGLVFLAKGLGHVWPYSLMAYGMNSNAPQKIMKSGYTWFAAICLVYIVIFAAASVFVIQRREV